MHRIPLLTLAALTLLPASYAADGGAASRAGRKPSIRANETRESAAPRVRAIDFKNQTVAVDDPTTPAERKVAKNEVSGRWTLMAVISQPEGALAVFENLQDRTGSILFVGTRGVVLELPKTLEPTRVSPGTLYRGRTMEAIAGAKSDVLGEDLLAGTGDPNYDDVAAALPPLRVPAFIGTNRSDDKPTFDYGAFSDEIYVDLGKLFPEIREARAKHDVWEGLIGGWLPVNRFVFPAADQRYWEETMFAEEPGHFWTQPIWFRALLVEGGQLKEAHYYYHHLPFPPRGEPAAAGFYEALLNVHSVWKRGLNPAMKIDVPDKKILDFCLHALALERITRVGDHPKYGYPPLGGINVFGGYGYNNVDTFQDTFNTSVDVFLEWGLSGIAGRYIDDYFTNSVRDDGSVDTRGPEIGQYGKMLTEVAKYWSYTKDVKLMRKHQEKIEAIVRLFFLLRKQAKELPVDDISYGIIRGWSEHDSSLKIDPYRFMQPHFSNNAEAARGFHDLGNAWIEMGRKTGDAHLAREGQRLLAESEAMRKDMESAIAKSIDRSKNPPYLPAVAGDHPTYGKERAYAEMLESGEITEAQARIILDNLAANGQSLFGLLRYGANIDGFLDYGPAYVRIERDWIREFLLLYYAHMAHIYSPGAWTAVESSKIDGTLGGPYCAPAEVAIPTFTKWMLAFEDPDQPILWLAKATPRAWLAQSQKISVEDAPTRFGNVSYDIRSNVGEGKISAVVRLPEGYAATTKLRVRAPEGKTMRAVTLNGAAWKDFSPQEEAVTIPPRFKGEIRIEISY
ncbi:MAG TPA: hypothetical protein VLY23_10040 [Candidatus Acidoferrum sp.]|nr:hypothetical protein [Candidatus Acidoferrum sp.]